jgi:putative transcriptional regulator
MKVKDPAKLRRKRMNRKYSQRDLAFLVKRSQNTIHLLETGGMKTLSEDLALLIAARLDVEWEDYFDLEEHEVMPRVTSNSHTTNTHEGKLTA